MGALPHSVKEKNANLEQHNAVILIRLPNALHVNFEQLMLA